MRNIDPRLSDLLRQWGAPVAPDNLEAKVWRRIQAAEWTAPVTFRDWLDPRLWRPAWSLGTAAALGIAIGVSSGIFSVPVTTPPPAPVSFLAPGTLTGTYVQLVTGVQR